MQENQNLAAASAVARGLPSDVAADGIGAPAPDVSTDAAFSVVPEPLTGAGAEPMEGMASQPSSRPAEGGISQPSSRPAEGAISQPSSRPMDGTASQTPAAPSSDAAPIPPVEPTEDSGRGGEAVTLADLARDLAELRAMIERPSAPAEVPQTGPEEPTLTDAFRALYPDLCEGDIPDAVWDEVRGGLPLEAAYALHERREQLRRKSAEAVNRKNAMGAWGRADDGADRSLSPDEVRAMTPQEVRDNYARIIQSMKHWN